MQKAVNNKKKKKRNFMPKVILAVFVVYASVTLISNQIEANEKNEETRKTEEIISNEKLRKIQLEQRNAQIEQMSPEQPDEEFIREKAEEQGYVDPNAIIFEDVSRN